jgi:apolipoprotein D and lipocalin family protein
VREDLQGRVRIRATRVTLVAGPPDREEPMPALARGIAYAAGLLLMVSACGSRHPPLPTVSHVDLVRYLGTWYEIARYPAPFQEGCVATSAAYSPREGGGIHVLNRCHVEHFDGELREAKGRAKIVDSATNARFKVTFFWPFWGDYWVLGLGPDYEWALVGEPSRRFLWILSRTPQMEPAVYDEIVGKLPELGYDAGRLIFTPQPEAR